MSRDYVFTCWKCPEPTEGEYSYLCYGIEQCPTTFRTHWQGLVLFNRTHRIPKAKRLVGGGDDSHFEPRKGSRDDARNYCRKDGDFHEFGNWVSLGLKTGDILQLPVSQIKTDYPLMYVRYWRGIERLHAVKSPDWRDVHCTWVWGETGMGKTRKVMSLKSVYKIDPPYKWWDGYENEDILLIDDYHSEAIPRGTFLNLLDGYPLRLETKGSHVWAHWTQVFVTSNYSPPNDPAVARRLTDVCNLCQGVG